MSSGLLVLAVVFAETKQASRICQDIVIKIVNKEEQRFVEAQDLLAQLTVDTTTPILGMPMQAINTKRIEDIVKKNNFVRKGIVYKNWQGVLQVAVVPSRPIARIVYPDRQGQYVDEDGTLLRLSDRYTARVLLVDAVSLGGVEQNLKEHAYGAALLALLSHIDRDPFWRSQITYMRINEKGKIAMHTQIGKQRIEFGTPEAIEEKLARLALFYKQIIPYKGWNAYQRVNIEFDNQIVCE